MGAYTCLNIKLKSNSFIKEQDITKIKEKLSLDCGTDSYKNIDKNNINLNITFNHGLDRMIDLIGLLEKFITYEDVTNVGTFSSNDIAGLYISSIFAYKDKLFIVNEDIKQGFIQQNYYFISDLRDNEEHYSIYIDENSPDEDLIKEKFIKEFLEKYYG